MKTSRNKSEIGQSLQNKDGTQSAHTSRVINFDDDIHLPRIERQGKAQEIPGNGETDQNDSRLVSSTSEIPRKRAGSSLEEAQKTSTFTVENTTTSVPKSGLSQTSRSIKTPLKTLQTENFMNNHLGGNKHHKDFRNSTHSIGEIKKECQAQSLGANKTPDSENKGSRVLNRPMSEEGRLSILRRDTNQTLGTTTISTMYDSQGREIDSIYSKSITQTASSPKEQRKLTFHNLELEDPLAAHHDSPVERYATTENDKNNLSREGKVINGREWRKEAPKRTEKKADLATELTSKVTLIRDKKHTFGKFSLTRPSSLQRLDRPSSNLREHIRREEVRYSQHQSETKRLLFEKWLRSTNQYLFQLNEGPTRS